MKICFLSTVDYTRMTASTIYCEYLKKMNIQFDFIYVDRKGENANNPYGASQSYGFIPKSKSNWNYIIKYLIGYIPFRKYALNIIKRNNYDFIIVWNELTGFLFSDILSRKFKGKYCINIRDYQYFDNLIVRNKLDKAVVNSLFTTVSSIEYKRYFNHDNVIPLFGTKIQGVEELKRNDLKKAGDIINILYIGQFNFLDYVFKYIEEFKNDSRFNLIFAGDGSEIVKEYAEKNNVKNIECYGRFAPNDTIKYLKKADVLYNLYGVSSKHLSLAISIKFYYSLYMKIPILVFKNTAMATMTEQTCTGFILDEKDFSNFADRLYNWYIKQDFEKISNACDLMIREIDSTQRNVFERINKYLCIGEEND